MKKIILIIISFFIFPITIWAVPESYIVMDMDSARVLMSNNMTKRKLIASTTKIMTAIIAIENGKLDKKIIINDSILSAYGSGIYIKVGEEITLRDLLYGLMLRSGNDAAIAIADNISRGMDKFAKLMNEKAIELKMYDTKFINAHGLENNQGDGNISTAYDMAILTKYAMQNKTYKEIVKTQKYISVTNQKTYIWYNKNRLLKSYEWTTGGKTGFTEKARRTLVTTASKDDKNVIIVTLNDGNDFNTHKLKYEEVFNNYDKKLIIDSKNLKIDNIFGPEKIFVKNNFSVLLKKNEEQNINLKYVYLDKVTNNQAGNILVYENDELLHTEPFYIKPSKIIKIKSIKWVDWIKLW